jgi:hypothetical protein
VVPHFTTALVGPLQYPEQRFIERMPAIEVEQLAEAAVPA